MPNSRSRSRSPIRSRSPRRSSGRDRDRSPLHRRGVSDRMIYMSNLPFETTWMQLKDLIREKVGEVNFVEVLQDRNGKSKGCAVVDFKTKDDANKCIESLHRMELHGRLIVAKEIRDPVAFFRKVKDDTGIDFLGRGDRGGGGGGGFGGQSHQHSEPAVAPRINENESYGLSPAFLAKLNISTPLERRVFITNISYNCGVGRLYDIFALAGRITWIDLQLDKEGKTKGICIVEYSHPIEAVQAISMLHNQRIFDRTISVKMDKFPREGENRRPGDLPFGLHSVGMGLGANGAPLTDVAGVISSLSTTTAVTVPTYQPVKVENGTVPVVPAQPQIAAPIAYTTPTAQQMYPSTGQYQDASAMYATQGTPTVATSMANIGAAGYPQQTQIRSTAMTGSYPPQMPSNVAVAGGTTATQQQWRAPQPSRVILIKNLPTDYTWQIVSDRVQQFGDLESVEMVSAGLAKIRFVQLKDAERAMNTLYGTKVEDRVIITEYL